MDTLGELSEESGSSEAEEDVPLPKAKKKKALAEPAPEELEHLGCAWFASPLELALLHSASLRPSSSAGTRAALRYCLCRSQSRSRGRPTGAGAHTARTWQL